jgi:Uma2 family endonuclease
MSTATVVPVQEYLETSYRPDCEYLEGEILERNVGEIDHSLLQGLLIHYLISRKGQWGITVLPEQRVQVKARRFRVPDISVIVGGRPPGRIIVQPPFLCIEVLSPTDRMAEMLERIDDYLSFGVPYVWLIHPATLRAFVYTREGVEEVKDGVLKTQNPDIYVPLAEL